METYQETLAHLTQAITQNPTDARSLAQRGETYRLLGRYEDALADFNGALELKPDYAWALAHRGETYRLLGRYEDALADFDRALELRPDHAWTLAHRGATHRLMRHSEAALADLDRSLELKPDNAWALIYRAETFVLLRRYENALADFDRALALDQLSINHQQGERGMLLNYLGRYPETIAACERALAENSNDYMALYCRAVARACEQGPAEAQVEIEAALVVLQVILQEGPEEKIRAGVLYRLGGLAALLGKIDPALDYLQEAIPLDYEPVEQARHDPAWSGLFAHPRYQALIAGTGLEK